MNACKQLLHSSIQGNFEFSPNEKIELRVNYAEQKITVCFFSSSAQLFPDRKKVHSSLHGMFGADSVETKFNQLVEKYKKPTT